MHALDLKGLVPFEKTLNMLVFRCGVEKGPVHVLGQTGKALPLPLLIVGADLVKPLGPGEVDGGKPRWVWLLLGGVDEVPGILDVRQGMDHLSRVCLARSMALSQRVLLVIGTAEGVLVTDIHFREGKGVGDGFEDSGLPLPEPVAEHVKGFADRPNLKTHLIGPNRLTSGRKTLAHNQHFALWLGHAHVEHGVLAKFGPGEFPEIDLRKQSSSQIKGKEA